MTEADAPSGAVTIAGRTFTLGAVYVPRRGSGAATRAGCCGTIPTARSRAAGSLSRCPRVGGAWTAAAVKNVLDRQAGPACPGE